MGILEYKFRYKDYTDFAHAAIKSHRHYVGYEINKEYSKLSKNRIKEFSLNFDAPKLFEFGKEG